MSYDTIRINELAKELNLTNKELIEKLSKISIVGKTHSSTLTPDQVRRIKEFIANGEKEVKPAKPKAFIVKKSKEAEKKEPIEAEEKKEPVKKEPEKPRLRSGHEPFELQQTISGTDPDHQRGPAQPPVQSRYPQAGQGTDDRKLY